MFEEKKEVELRKLGEYYKFERRDVDSKGGIPIAESLHKDYFDDVGEIFPVHKNASHHIVKNLKTEVAYTPLDVNVGSVSEGGIYLASSPEIGGHMFYLNKRGGISKVAQEVLDDTIRIFVKIIHNSFARSLGELNERDFINGDGSGRPRGYLRDCLTVTGTSGISFNDIVNVFHGLKINYLSNAVWIVNQKAFTDLIGLSDANGNRVLIPGNEAAGPMGYIFGKPVFISFLPENKPISFGSFEHYKILEQPPMVQKLSELYALDNFVGFKMTQFIDGKLLRSDAIIALEVN